jgi:hypothetical protein
MVENALNLRRRSSPRTPEVRISAKAIFSGRVVLPDLTPRVLIAALVFAAPACLVSAQDAKVSVDMIGI